MLYSYRCIDNEGSARDGRIDADTVYEARQRLERKGWHILIIQGLGGDEPVPPERPSALDPARVAAQDWPDDWEARVRCPATTVVLFTRQLGTMLAAGFPLLHALDTLSGHAEHPVFGEVVGSVAESIEHGHTLSSALGRFPGVFSGIYLSMVRIGEDTGGLGAVLDRLASWQERDFRLHQRVKSSLTYPVFVLTLAGGLSLILFYTVLPGFIGVLEQMEVKLPLVTRLVFALTRLVSNPGAWIVAVAVGVGLFAWLRETFRTQRGTVALFTGLRRVPLLGGMLACATTARFSAAVGALLRSGVGLTRSLELGAGASGSPILAGDAARLVENLQHGEQLSSALGCRPELYPTTIRQMVRAGEETSTLPEMFERLARFYDAEVCFRIDVLEAALEPLLLGLVATVVGTVVLSIFLPMYGYLEKLGG